MTDKMKRTVDLGIMWFGRVAQPVGVIMIAIGLFIISPLILAGIAVLIGGASLDSGKR